MTCSLPCTTCRLITDPTTTATTTSTNTTTQYASGSDTASRCPHLRDRHRAKARGCERVDDHQGCAGRRRRCPERPLLHGRAQDAPERRFANRTRGEVVSIQMFATTLFHRITSSSCKTRESPRSDLHRPRAHVDAR